MNQLKNKTVQPKTFLYACKNNIIPYDSMFSISLGTESKTSR